ncbi:MAG: hypothetical protein C4554_04450 [Dethiobacter sp.]|jgi:hypothetical protein|nr:MAG: hypothetical protein C4554_04450 [Dethiobacter sp.]
MYPLTHLYFAGKVLGSLDDSTVLGSIFPDMTILIDIDWNRSHSLGLELWRHFQEKNKDLVDFSLGVISHGIEPKGLDYYSDEKFRSFEKGYCFEKARPLVESVVEACFISSGDGWWKAHNFIEMGIELYIYEKRPELLPLLQKSLADAVLVRKLCQELSSILDRDETTLEKMFSAFKKFFADEPLDAQLLALRYQKQIYFRHNIESIDLVKSRDIIQKAKELVVSDIEDFFLEVKEQMAPIWNEVFEKN